MLISPTTYTAAPEAPSTAAPPQVRQANAVSPTANSDTGVRIASAQEIRAAVAALNKKMEPLSTSVRFALDDSTGKTVITMLDTADNSVLRQFPSNETLSMIRALDQHSGLLVNTKS